MNTQHPDLLTPRLALVAITPEMLRSKQADDRTLGTLLHAALPPSWPPVDWEPYVFAILLAQYDRTPEQIAWHRYITLRNADGARLVIGPLERSGGRPHPPNARLDIRSCHRTRGRDSPPKRPGLSSSTFAAKAASQASLPTPFLICPGRSASSRSAAFLRKGLGRSRPAVFYTRAVDPSVTWGERI